MVSTVRLPRGTTAGYAATSSTGLTLSAVAGDLQSAYLVGAGLRAGRYALRTLLVAAARASTELATTGTAADVTIPTA